MIASNRSFFYFSFVEVPKENGKLLFLRVVLRLVDQNGKVFGTFQFLHYRALKPGTDHPNKIVLVFMGCVVTLLSLQLVEERRRVL